MDIFKKKKLQESRRKGISHFDCIVRLKTFLGGIFVLGFILGINACSQKEGAVQLQQCFTPGDNCTQSVIKTIEKAKKEILVQAYVFTSQPIAVALIKAHQMGIKVTLLVDQSQENYKKTQVYTMIANGIPVFIDKVPGIAHNKIMIIDDTYVITGSFNFTNAAEYRNAENVLIIKSKDNNSAYRKNFYTRARTAARLNNNMAKAA